MNQRLPRSVWIPVLLLALVVFGWRMNTQPLTNWDEGIYANVNLELFRTHDWTKLTYFGADFLEKPPLQFWATSVLYGVFGPTEFSVRLIPVLAGMATALLISLWAWQVSRRRTVAWLAAGMLIFGRFAVIHAFRTGDLDALLALFITLAMYGYWRSWTAPRWIVVWGVASAGAIMTKSFVGLLPLMVVGLDILISRGWRRIGWSNIAWAVVVFLVLAVPWHVVETMRFGRAFWDDYVGLHVIERTTESLFGTTPWYWYFGMIRDRFYPWSYLLPAVFLVIVRSLRKPDGQLARMLLLWAVMTFTIFSFIQTRRDWYILPLYPALILLTAPVVDDWLRHAPRRLMSWIVLLSSGAMFGHALADHHIKPRIQQTAIGAHSNTAWSWFALELVFGAVVIALILGISWLLRRYRWSWRQWAAGFVVAGMMTLATSWMVFYLRAVPMTLPLKTIGARLEQEHQLSVSLIGTLLKKEPAGYFYILRLDTHTSEYKPGTPPATGIILTTNESKNIPLNTEGKVLAKAGKFLLLDLR